MGMTCEISTLEEMCDLMCDNVIPADIELEPEQEGWWFFTFGAGQEHEGHFVRLYGTFESTRKKMFDIYGTKWAFQYSEKGWKKMADDPQRHWSMETELVDIDHTGDPEI